MMDQSDQNNLRFAKSEKRRLRAAGMKHSWSDMFSNTGEILMYLLPLSVTDTISFARTGLEGMEEELRSWGSDLSGIEVRLILAVEVCVYDVCIRL